MSKNTSTPQRIRAVLALHFKDFKAILKFVLTLFLLYLWLSLWFCFSTSAETLLCSVTEIIRSYFCLWQHHPKSPSLEWLKIWACFLYQMLSSMMGRPCKPSPNEWKHILSQSSCFVSLPQRVMQTSAGFKDEIQHPIQRTYVPFGDVFWEECWVHHESV